MLSSAQMILKSAISADSLLDKDAFRASFHLHFYEIMGSLTKYRLSVILYGRKDMRLILQIPKVESL